MGVGAFDLLDDYRQAAALFGERLSLVGDDDWANSTPCDDWDVRSLVAHLIVGEFLVAALFRVKQGEMAMAAHEGGFAVGVLTDIEAAKPEQNKKDYDEVRKQLHQSMVGDLVAQFSAALRSSYTVTVNDSAVDALF